MCIRDRITRVQSHWKRMDGHPSGEVLDTCDNAISSAVLTILRQRRCEWYIAIQDTCSVTIAPNRYKENSSTQCEPY